MKKKLEAELISIAHRILKLKNKSDVVQLHQETQKLYEKLSVLKFLEENFATVSPTIGKAQAEEILETAFDDKQTIAEEERNEVPPVETPAAPEIAASPEVAEQEEPAPEVEAPTAETEGEKPEESETEAEEQSIEAATAEIPNEPETDIPAEENVVTPTESEAEEPISEPEKEETPSKEEDLFKPAFEWQFSDAEETKPESKPASGQIAFDELLGKGYTDPVFVKPEDLAREKTTIPENAPISVIPPIKSNTEIADKTISLNDRLSKGITVGLNDRIAFVKHLFGNSNEDYNRVLSQLITFNTYEEAVEFIDTMVKPDYNDWHGKDEYAQRFMEVVEKKFT